MSDHADLITRLRNAVGEAQVLTAAADLAPYVVDWTGQRQGFALAVVRPATTEEVASVVRLCRDAGVAIVPQGGNTGLSGGAVPDTGQVVVSLGRLRAVRSVDPVSETLTVEAGVQLHDAQTAAARVDRLFPLSLGSEGSCTIGGNVSTNAGGTAVLRYGMMRDLVLGVEVVLPDGRVWDGLRGLRKDNTGYDLTQLYVGAEGTLGIVTAATLRLFPATPQRATAFVALPSVAAAVSLLGVLRQHTGERLTTWELTSRQCLDLVLTHLPASRDPFGATHPWYGLIELAASATATGVDEALEAALGAAFEQDQVLDAVVAGSPAQRASLWALREGISEAQKVEGASIKHDVTVPIGSLAAFCDDVEPRLAALQPGVRPMVYGHVGDGNLHYNLSGPPDAAASTFLDRAPELTAEVYDVVASFGGSISAEHGLGTAKRDAAATRRSEVETSLMRAVKDALDPHGLMNPGKVLPLA